MPDDELRRAMTTTFIATEEDIPVSSLEVRLTRVQIGTKLFEVRAIDRTDGRVFLRKIHAVADEDNLWPGSSADA